MQKRRMQCDEASLEPIEGALLARWAWRLTSFVLGVDLCWLLLGEWSVSWRGVAAIATAVAGGQALLLIGRYRRDLRIRTTVQAATLLILFTAAAGTLSYLVVSTNAPLIDARLAVWDRALGFDWLALDDWLRRHPTTAAILRLSYQSGLVQLAFVVMYLGFTGRCHAMYEFLHIFISVTLISIALSGVFPAAGAWKYYGLTSGYDLASQTHFELLRNGLLRDIPLHRMQGLISIPSMHAATAVLLVYALRGSWRLLPVFTLLNGAMLLATPIDGSHFLVDVLVGVVLVIGLIGLVRRVQMQSATLTSPVQAAAFRVMQQ